MPGSDGRLLGRDERPGLGLGDFSGVAWIAVDEGLRRLGSLLAGKPHHLAVIVRERASGVGIARIAGARHGLATAAADINLAAGARAAGLLPPCRAAEGAHG